MASGAMREIVLSLFLLFAGLGAVASSQVQALLLPESAAGTPYIFKAPASLLGEGEVNAGGYSSSERTGVPAAGAVEPAMHVLLKDCPYDQTHARECRVHWAPLAIESSLFLAFENAGNLYTGYSYRWDTTHGKWWDRYINSVKDFRFNRWSDDNPWYDDYVGHPMMGAIRDFIWIQNDPKGMTLEFSNTSPYWISRLRAMTFSALYSLEWKIGPVGEASIGHNDYYFPENVGGPWTNETGWVTLVTTPVGGTLWAVGEDLLDRSVIHYLENKSRNPFLLLSYQFLNPARATANILRFRPPWYRDSRTVKADSFWSDPTPEIAEGTVAANVIMPVKQPQSGPYGGRNEFGACWGLSLFSGNLFGSESSVKYMPIDVLYSRLLTMRPHFAFRYAPELTALAMFDEPVPGAIDPPNLRHRSYGSGLNPEAFELGFRPTHKVQPFLSQSSGFVYYFTAPVLLPKGSQFTYSVDFGGGVRIFRKLHQSYTLGYRYRHIENSGFSRGTDANTFYVGVSRFR
ncbi:MAG TPA: acyloxyacyl hydrolase [Terriglobales bacterium]